MVGCGLADAVASGWTDSASRRTPASCLLQSRPERGDMFICLALPLLARAKPPLRHVVIGKAGGGGDDVPGAHSLPRAGRLRNQDSAHGGFARRQFSTCK